MSQNIEGVSVALPFVYSNEDGPYRLNKTLLETVRQNLKNLILTSPGERIMIPEFGVGLRRFLFEGISSKLYQQLDFKIREQINKYMPFVNIEQIKFFTMENNAALAPNEVNVQLVYNLGQVAASDVLSISQLLN